MRTELVKPTELYPGLTIIGVGAGAIKSNPEKVDRGLSIPDATHITQGSYPDDARAGNSGEVFFISPDGFISANALGIPGKKFKDEIENLRNTYPKYKQANKTRVLSIGCFTRDIADEERVDRIVHMIEQANDYTDLFEINGGSPNTFAKQIHGYSNTFLELLEQKLAPFGRKFWFKAPNYNIFGNIQLELLFKHMNDLALVKGYRINVKESDFTKSSLDNFNSAVDFINNSKIFCGVVGPNTIPNCEVVDIETNKPVLRYSNEFGQTDITTGGLGGGIVLNIACPQIRMLKQKLNPEIDLIVTGGAGDVINAKNYLEAGANGLMFVTDYLKHGPDIVADTLVGLHTQFPLHEAGSLSEAKKICE